MEHREGCVLSICEVLDLIHGAQTKVSNSPHVWGPGSNPTVAMSSPSFHVSGCVALALCYFPGCL